MTGVLQNDLISRIEFQKLLKLTFLPDYVTSAHDIQQCDNDSIELQQPDQLHFQMTAPTPLMTHKSITIPIARCLFSCRCNWQLLWLEQFSLRQEHLNAPHTNAHTLF